MMSYHGTLGRSAWHRLAATVEHENGWDMDLDVLGGLCGAAAVEAVNGPFALYGYRWFDFLIASHGSC